MQNVLYTLLNEFGGNECIIPSNEKDFQAQFAAKLQKHYSDIYTVEREYPTRISGERPQKIDIVLQTPERLLPIELKYKLKQGHNPDDARYFFFRDVWRIEQILSSHEEFGPVGYAIFMTNDPRFWKTPCRNIGPNRREFRIHNGCHISGTRTWWATGKRVAHRKFPVLTFQGFYQLAWRECNSTVMPTDVSTQLNNFRYIMVEIKQLR